MQKDGRSPDHHRRVRITAVMALGSSMKPLLDVIQRAPHVAQDDVVLYPGLLRPKRSLH